MSDLCNIKLSCEMKTEVSVSAVCNIVALKTFKAPEHSLLCRHSRVPPSDLSRFRSGLSSFFQRSKQILFHIT